ncbi:MAG: hypothetical protein WD009_02940 [Phycisphaeraceae bacterium]
MSTRLLTPKRTRPDQPDWHVFQQWLPSLREVARELDDPRATPRYPVHGPIKLGHHSPFNKRFMALCDGWATDLSAQGLGALVEYPLPPTGDMAVDLTHLVGQRCVLPLRVVYVRPLLAHVHRLGAMFTCSAG